ncbi:uncharacterized protein LOC129742662 [Uranotaenia lowii]|uniref:uncharacterized protein LOC129742662 n=1 Tax=Uranotaenia lowii TaxID=190385 RepID=UPI002479857A|nr:uncharacterized protein LOC129742662 [Uranotaenia lowii]
MHSKCLLLAHHKIELVLIINLITPQTDTFVVGPFDIVAKSTIKYLGVMIDDGLSFTSHVNVAMATAALTIRSSKKRILSSVTLSILRYGAAAWRQALGRQWNLQRLSSIQRLMNLRVIST